MSTIFAKKLALSLKRAIQSSHPEHSEDFFKKILLQKKGFYSKIREDPISLNLFSYLLSAKKQNPGKTRAELLEKLSIAINHLNNSYSQIAESGYRKIRNGSVVYVHSHSISILNILLRAKKQGARFDIHTTDTEMAKTLAKFKLKTKFYSPLAARQALKRADIILMDAYVISEHGQVYSKIGSELMAETAEKYDIPVYICADSWKFNPEAAREFSSTNLKKKEKLWSNPPKDVFVMNYAYEKINPKLITGIISESGICRPQDIAHH